MHRIKLPDGRRRRITVREAARLQSFPDSFIPDTKNAQAYKQFGNAVNVQTVKLFAAYLFGDPQVRARYSAE